ncbi:MAG: hypothetical protein HYV26_14325, partial [Candidatus Hydrogenedentes bacterium]|nr:hypothetical protein [Candidatus Hydrogenedentota bacterium]
KAGPSAAIPTGDDFISLGTNGTELWNQTIADLTPGGGFQIGAWQSGNSKIVTLDLESLPINANPTQNVDLLDKGDACNLDVLIANHTAVDYMKLTITTCCDEPVLPCGPFTCVRKNGTLDVQELLGNLSLLLLTAGAAGWMGRRRI